MRIFNNFCKTAGPQASTRTNEWSCDTYMLCYCTVLLHSTRSQEFRQFYFLYILITLYHLEDSFSHILAGYRDRNMFCHPGLSILSLFHLPSKSWLRYRNIKRIQWAGQPGNCTTQLQLLLLKWMGSLQEFLGP